MKTFKIGNTEYELCENAEDLNIKRFNELKVFLMQKETGISLPSLIENYKQKLKAYDNESKSDMLIADFNFLMGLQNVENREDSDQLFFSIICLEKGEDPTKYDKTKAKEKLDRMAQDGLTQGVVKKEVEDFLSGSSILSELYFLKNLESLQSTLTK